MPKSTQLRIRLPAAAAGELTALPPRQRARVVSLVLNAQLAGVQAADLVQVHRNLVAVGHLLNRSLRVSRGLVANVVAVEECVELVKGLTR